MVSDNSNNWEQNGILSNDCSGTYNNIRINKKGVIYVVKENSIKNSSTKITNT